MYQEKILESASILFFIWRLIQSSKVEYVLVFSIFSVLKTLKLTGEKLVYCFIDLSIIIGYVDWTAVFPVLNQYWCVYFSPEALFSSSCVYAKLSRFINLSVTISRQALKRLLIHFHPNPPALILELNHIQFTTFNRHRQLWRYYLEQGNSSSKPYLN